MADVQIDYTAIQHSRSQVDSAISTLQQAGAMSADLAALVGHDGLASKVNEFADDWDINRGRMIEELSAISDTLQAIVDTFSDFDQRAADELEADR